MSKENSDNSTLTKTPETNPAQSRRGGAPEGNRNAQTHGLNTMKRAVKRLGNRAIDMRTKAGRALSQWRRDLIDDLGGIEAISTQQLALIELALRQKLLLDSIDAWLLTQELVSKRSRTLIKVLKERQQLADALAKYLTQLGLERRKKPGKSIYDKLMEPEKVDAMGGDE